MFWGFAIAVGLFGVTVLHGDPAPVLSLEHGLGDTVYVSRF